MVMRAGLSRRDVAGMVDRTYTETDHELERRTNLVLWIKFTSMSQVRSLIIFFDINFKLVRLA